MSALGSSSARASSRLSPELRALLVKQFGAALAARWRREHDNDAASAPAVLTSRAHDAADRDGDESSDRRRL